LTFITFEVEVFEDYIVGVWTIVRLDASLDVAVQCDCAVLHTAGISSTTKIFARFVKCHGKSYERQCCLSCNKYGAVLKKCGWLF